MTHTNQARIRVGTATCGIAMGAAETLRCLLEAVEAQRLAQIQVEETGCIGLCSLEPLVEVALDGRPSVFYARVDPQAALRILDEHVLGGQIVQDYHIDVQAALLGG